MVEVREQERGEERGEEKRKRQVKRRGGEEEKQEKQEEQEEEVEEQEWSEAVVGKVPSSSSSRDVAIRAISSCPLYTARAQRQQQLPAVARG